MNSVSRRNFIVPMIGTAAVAAITKAASPVNPPQVTLGNTGVTMSRMGFGTGVKAGNRKSALTRQGFEKAVGLFRHAYDRGVRYVTLCHTKTRDLPSHLRRADIIVAAAGTPGLVAAADLP